MVKISLQKLMGFLNLIRYQNLLIIVATQFMVRYFIIAPHLKVHNLVLQHHFVDFLLLVFATVLIAAAGNIINDYFDLKTDLINKPEKVVVGKIISRRWAMVLHTILSFTGIGIGGWISYKIGYFNFIAVFILFAGLLWYYSAEFKRQFLIGNFIIALLTAMVPLMVILYEIPLINTRYYFYVLANILNVKGIIAWVICFAVLGFLINLFREMIKDCQDVIGDKAFGCNTLPLVIGIKNTKLIITLLISGTIALLVVLYFKYLTHWPHGNLNWIVPTYILVLIILPLSVVIYKVIKAKNAKDFLFASTLSKIIMLAGLSFALIIKILL